MLKVDVRNGLRVRRIVKNSRYIGKQYEIAHIQSSIIKESKRARSVKSEEISLGTLAGVFETCRNSYENVKPNSETKWWSGCHGFRNWKLESGEWHTLLID